MGVSFWLCSVITERWERRRKARQGVHATNVQTSETQGSYQPLDEAAQCDSLAVRSCCRFLAPRAAAGAREQATFRFRRRTADYLNCLLALGCKVRPGFRLVECHCVIQAVPFDDARTLGRRRAEERCVG